MSLVFFLSFFFFFKAPRDALLPSPSEPDREQKPKPSLGGGGGDIPGTRLRAALVFC